MSLAISRIQSQIQKELSKILALEVKEEDLHLVTITEVRVTNDLSYATIYYTVLGKDKRKEKVNEAFNRAKGYLRSEFAKRVIMRKVPDFIFKFDEALEYGNHIENVLNSLNKWKWKPVYKKQVFLFLLIFKKSYYIL